MALTAGIIGLGNIGCGVAANLAAAGHHVIGYDLDPERITAASAEAGVDAADVAARTDLVVLAVATLPAWRATLAAISASGRRGLVVVDLCTFPIEEKVDAHDELARAGIETLIFGGIVTNGGVASTVRDAHVRDFHTTVMSDGCAAFSDAAHNSTIGSLSTISEITTCAEMVARL